MKTYRSPCVAVLGAVADATAAEYADGTSVSIVTDRATCSVQLRIHLPRDQMAVAHMSCIDAIDEVVRDLMAARADLVKLMKGAK